MTAGTVGRICTARGCARINCSDPAHERRDSRNRRQPGSLQRAVYDSADWQRVRTIVFVRDEYTCVDCGFYSPDGRGLVCDHDTAIVELVAAGRKSSSPPAGTRSTPTSA